MRFTSTLLALTLCACASSTPVPTPLVEVPPVEIAIPDSGFWDKADTGWRYDLAVSFVPEVQLNAPGSGEGLMRVVLPPGATTATVTALTVKYTRSPPDMEPDTAASSGKALWHLRADQNGRPGATLAILEVDINGARSTPIDYESEETDIESMDLEGTRHAFATPIAVPRTFWLVFVRKSGDPRVGGMRLTEGNGLLGTYTDLYFRASPEAPIGQPLPVRPLIALDFQDLR